MLLVSACLLGYNCKYSGSNNFRADFIHSIRGEIVLSICPEVLGGLPTPRCPCEISGGTAAEVFAGQAQVLDKNGRDCTTAFLCGAKKALQIAHNAHITQAILKKNSPSCGYGTVYDGHFHGRKIPGNGITAELFVQNGISVWDEEAWIALKNRTKENEF